MPDHAAAEENDDQDFEDLADTELEVVEILPQQDLLLVLCPVASFRRHCQLAWSLGRES